jgi:Mn2+/Fe2+ NRAMP family transporter
VTFRTFLRQKHRKGSPEDRGKLLRWPAVAAEHLPAGGWKNIRQLGPGIVTGASDVDPSLVLTATVAGAAFGYSLLWVIPLCVPFLFAVFAVAARIGRETRQGLVDLLRTNYGRSVALVCALMVIVINMAMIIADILAVTDALSILLDQRRIFFIAAVAFSVWYILIFQDYQKITRALVFLALPLFAYVAAAVLAEPSVLDILKHTFIPRTSGNSEYTTAFIALLGSLLTPYVIVWQTSSRREDANVGWHEAEHHAGTLVTSLISYAVLIAAAAILNPTSTLLPVAKIENMTFLQAAQALSPLGELGPILFAIGIVGAGSVALPVLVASMCYGFSEAMGWKSGLSEHPWEAKRFYVLISAAVFIAAAVNFFKINPVAMLYWSQILAGVLTVPILIFILLLSNDRRVMRTTNTRWQNFWLGAAIGGLISAGALVLWWKLIG